MVNSFELEVVHLSPAYQEAAVDAGNQSGGNQD